MLLKRLVGAECSPLRSNTGSIRGRDPPCAPGHRVHVLNSDFERLVGGAALEQASPEATAFWEGTEIHADPVKR
jgi:hypothetical protein